MLSLRHGGPAILSHIGIAGLFAPVHPDSSATALYDSIVLYGDGKPGDNISSEGFECCQVNEFGDALNLTGSGTVSKVSVVMQSWGCEQGNWYSHNCQTNKGDTFPEPITLSIYSVVQTSGNPQPGILLARKTRTFNIHFRPSANPRCIGTSYSAGGFIGRPDGYCDEGLSQLISWKLVKPIMTLPSQVIVTVSYNTSTSGYTPYGTGTTCYSSSGGCGYDSLNVSADGNGGFIGSPIDPNGVQVYYSNSSIYEEFGCTTYNSNYTVHEVDRVSWTLPHWRRRVHLWHENIPGPTPWNSDLTSSNWRGRVAESMISPESSSSQRRPFGIGSNRPISIEAGAAMG